MVEDLSRIELCELEDLCFKYNKISDISPFSYAKFENLKLLNLSYNEITNINVLKEVDF